MNIEEIIHKTVFETLLEIRTSFRWNEFKKLKHPREQISYAKTHLKFLGEGSSRTVFLLSNRYVLKMARPSALGKGKAQNEVEVELFTDPKTQPIVASIYDFDPKYHWLVSELVRPMHSEEEFEKMTGIDFDTLFNITFTIEDSDDINSLEKLIKNFEREIEYKDYRTKNFQRLLGIIKNNNFAQLILKLILEDGLLSGDVLHLNHWGKTAGGKVVLLDYGYNEEVQKKHYSW